MITWTKVDLHTSICARSAIMYSLLFLSELVGDLHERDFGEGVRGGRSDPTSHVCAMIFRSVWWGMEVI